MIVSSTKSTYSQFWLQPTKQCLVPHLVPSPLSKGKKRGKKEGKRKKGGAQRLVPHLDPSS
eukprot:1155102-Pelagomonas_calceolata.AAC.10